MYITVKGARGGHEIRDKPLRKFRGRGLSGHTRYVKEKYNYK